jgi:hypothetical protein
LQSGFLVWAALQNEHHSRCGQTRIRLTLVKLGAREGMSVAFHGSESILVNR